MRGFFAIWFAIFGMAIVTGQAHSVRDAAMLFVTIPVGMMGLWVLLKLGRGRAGS